jgi:hypothetical protein
VTPVGQWRATYTPGDWLVLAGPTSLVVVEPPGEGWTPLVEELWQQVLASSSLVDLAGRLAGYGLDTMPSFGALFWSADAGMRSLVRGSVTVLDAADGRVVASGEGIQTWSEMGLGELSMVLVQTDSVVPSGPETLRLPLVVGAVSASSVLLDAREGARVHSPQLDDDRSSAAAVEPTSRTLDAREDEDEDEDDHEDDFAGSVEPTQMLPPPDQPPPADEPTEVDPAQLALENADTELVQLTPAAVDPGAAADPGPTVDAVVCPHGHPNPPGELRCRDCGISVTDQRVRALAQPVLALLRGSDGSEAPVDRSVLVGRAPAERGPGPVRLLTVPSPSHDISRTHLQISVDGWQVTATDLHSTNGTLLVSRDGTRRSLPPGHPVPVVLGDVLELAEGISVTLTDPR